MSYYSYSETSDPKFSGQSIQVSRQSEDSLSYRDRKPLNGDGLYYDISVELDRYRKPSIYSRVTIVDPKRRRCAQINLSLREKGWFGDADPDLELDNGVDTIRASVVVAGGLSETGIEAINQAQVIHLARNAEWTLLRTYNDKKKLSEEGCTQAIQARLEELAASNAEEGTSKQRFDDKYIGPSEGRPEAKRVANAMAEILKLDNGKIVKSHSRLLRKAKKAIDNRGQVQDDDEWEDY